MVVEHGERGDIVLGWLTRVIIVLVVFGTIVFEAVSIGVAHVRTQDLAVVAAREGSEDYSRSRNVQRAYEIAAAVAAEKDGTIEPDEFVVEPDGTVQATVHKEAGSLLLRRFKATRKWLQVAETGRARFEG